jgi:hypothetical protein
LRWPDIIRPTIPEALFCGLDSIYHLITT